MGDSNCTWRGGDGFYIIFGGGDVEVDRAGNRTSRPGLIYCKEVK